LFSIENNSGEISVKIIEGNCHICGHITDFECDSCGEPVCYDCCVKMTIHNQIDYPLCKECNDNHECAKAEHYQRIEEEKETEKLERERKSKLRRTNYYKPENIEKRRLDKIERKRLAKDQMIKRWQDAVNIANSFFK
jgi:hypothetical protein